MFFTTRQSVVTPKEINELTALCSQNLEEIAKYIGVEKTDIIVPEQTHSANIAIAQKGKTYPNTDALVVEDPNLAILLNFADCTPVILYDEAKTQVLLLMRVGEAQHNRLQQKQHNL